MSGKIPAAFIEQIPKSDLHVHLDGSLRLPTLIELAKDAGITLPAGDADGLRRAVFKDRYANLPEYLAGFRYTCAVLQTEESLERVAYELAEDNIAEGVRYIEVRFAPQLHVRPDLSFEQILQAVGRGLARAARRHNAAEAVRREEDVPFHAGIIVCAMRRFTAEMSPYYAALMQSFRFAPVKQIYAAASLEMVRAAVAIRDQTGLPIVGFDLAGEEAGFPAGDHREAYGYAHRNFLLKTVHAGEVYGPESIFQALTDCHANRIGHGTFLFDASLIRDPAIQDPKRYVEQLAEFIANRRITVEVCLTSNLQTSPDLGRMEEHPFRQMIERNLSVSLCTDNRLVSHTSVTQEMRMAADRFDLRPDQFRNLVAAGFKGSFFPGSYSEKRAFVRKVLNRVDTLEQAHIASGGSAS